MADSSLLTQVLSNCAECGTLRTVSAVDAVELIFLFTDSQTPVTGVCMKCHTPWVLGWSERQEIASEMARALRAPVGGDT